MSFMWESHCWYYFTRKWRAETLQRGLEFANFKPRLESGIFKCITWLDSFFFSDRGFLKEAIKTYLIALVLPLNLSTCFVSSHLLSHGSLFYLFHVHGPSGPYSFFILKFHQKDSLILDLLFVWFAWKYCKYCRWFVSLENCRCKSSLVKPTGCEHVFDAFDPYHPFPPCERLFWRNQ
jgi:hypothetical protein